ncbi:hypothetical protein ACHAPU_002548 [Fusarium lateritium]
MPRIIQTPKKSLLLQLPTELLEIIANDECLTHREVKCLRHTSARLFYVTYKAICQGKDFIMFRQAVAHGDLAMMAQCKRYNSPPINVMWHWVKHRLPGKITWKISEGDALDPACTHPGPGYFLFRGYNNGKVSVDQYMEAAEWLIDNGYQAFNGRTDYGGRFPPAWRWMSYELIDELENTRRTRKGREIHRIIHFLHGKGVKMPNSKRPRGGHTAGPILTLLTHSESPLRYPRQPSIMQILMQSACDASILELYLKQIDDEGLTLKFQVSGPESNIRGMETCQTTRVEHMFHIFFDELFKKAKWWKEGSSGMDPGKVRDTFEAKLLLLIEHKSINDYEHEILYELLLALRQIAARSKMMGGLNFEEDGVWCWYKLCMSIRRLYLDSATHPDLVPEESEEDASVMHRFRVQKYYYPPEYLSVYRGQKVGDSIATTRPNTRGWARRRAQDDRALYHDWTTRDWWNMPLDAWDFILVHRDEFFLGLPTYSLGMSAMRLEMMDRNRNR